MVLKVDVSYIIINDFLGFGKRVVDQAEFTLRSGTLHLEFHFLVDFAFLDINEDLVATKVV